MTYSRSSRLANMISSITKENNAEPSSKIENNVHKGKVVPHKSAYTSVGKLVFDILKSHPDHIGQVDAITGKEDSFENIADRAVKCALWLHKHGVGKDDVVAICSHNQLDCVIPFLATLFLGAIVNPWDYQMNITLARHFVKLSQPKVVFADEKSAGVALEASKIELFHTEVVTFGDHPGTTPLSEILEGHSKSALENFQCTEIDDPSHTAFVIFSSGTTGLPKGSQLSHYTMIYILELVDELDMNELKPMWFTTLYWISGCMLSLKNIVCLATRIVGPDFDEKTACELIEKFKVSWLMFSTSMANRFIRYPHLQEYDLSCVKLLFTGGAAMKKEAQDLLKERLPDTLIIQAYGMTELGGLVAIQSKDSTSGSCGKVSTNCEIKVVDIETGEALGPNQTGEICAKTLTMMTGYYKNPEATKSIIDNDGWLHSGDLGYYNEEGEFFIVDRLKELIKYRGNHIAPTQIENLLQTHPAVLEAAVIGIPHPTDDEHPVAFISKVPNKEVFEEELIQLVANNLMDSFKLRGGVRFLPSLPHTPSSKISRKELKAIANQMQPLY